MTEKLGYGPHLTMDFYGCQAETLSSLEHVYQFLDEIPGLIGMTKITPPFVMRYHGQEPDEWGISGMVLIAESHITVHTYPEKGAAFLDIFSCKEYDHGRVLAQAVEWFRPDHYDDALVNRGRNFKR